MEIQVAKMWENRLPGKKKANVTLKFHGLFLDGFGIIQGENGLFVGYPREKGSDGKFYKTVRPENEDINKQISDTILNAWNARALHT